jgi:YbbR domain-containing protein
MKIPLPDLILRNFWLKFFSVALATVIWLAIYYGTRNQLSISQLNINNLLAQEYVRVPVTIVAPPGDARVFKINPNEVVVIAVGEKNALRKAAQKSIRVYVDVTRFHSRQSEVEELHADVPPDINVLEISPATVAIEQVSK